MRSLELPCRNEWAKDLWQSAEEASGAFDLPAINATPELPISIDEVRFLTSRNVVSGGARAAESVAAQGEDVVVGETVTMAARDDAGSPTDARGKLRRAHEEMRLRNRERRPELSPKSSYGEFSVPPEASPTTASQAASRPYSRGHESPAPLANGGVVPPVSRAEMGRPLPEITTYASDVDVFGTIPEQDEHFALPLLKPAKTESQEKRDPILEPIPDDELVSWGNAATQRTPIVERSDWQTRSDGQRVADLPRVSTTMREACDVNTARDGSMQWRADERFERSTNGANRSELASFALDSDDDKPFMNDLPPRRPEREREARIRVERQESRDERRIDARISAAVDEILAHQRERVDATNPTTNRAVDDAQAREFVADYLETDQIYSAPSREDQGDQDSTAEERKIPWESQTRMCRTCRDFRPAENGERGWCANKWAFTHRRMVDADEFPCETSIGGWWLPNDDLWLSAVDVSAHGLPTPLVDEWLAAKAAARGEYDAIAPIRRRRRS